MSDTLSNTEINRNGLWNNNVALVQLLGLCPLLAISNTTINAFGLGVATLLTLVLSNISVSMIRHWVRPEVRVPVFVLIIASIVTVIEFIMNAHFHELYGILGIFIPLIVTNCAILARAEAFAAKNNITKSAIDGFAMGTGFLLVLLLLGGFRELLGQGTLLANADLMFGETAKHLVFHINDDYQGFLLAILPPGAFMALGLMIALKNIIDKRLEQKQAATSHEAPQPETA